MKFERLYQLVLEKTSFADLPDTAPYGFWIYPNGDIQMVEYEQHAKVGWEKIIAPSPVLLQQFFEMFPDVKAKSDIQKKHYANIFLKKKNFCRVMCDTDYGNILYYAGAKNRWSPIQLSNAQKQTAKDLAMLYDMRAVED